MLTSTNSRKPRAPRVTGSCSISPPGRLGPLPRRESCRSPERQREAFTRLAPSSPRATRPFHLRRPTRQAPIKTAREPATGNRALQELAGRRVCQPQLPNSLQQLPPCPPVEPHAGEQQLQAVE